MRIQFNPARTEEERYRNLVEAVLSKVNTPESPKSPRPSAWYDYDPMSRLRLIFIRPSKDDSGLSLAEEFELEGSVDLPARCQKCGEYTVVTWECLQCGRIQR